jgi:hypothetical protein
VKREPLLLVETLKAIANCTLDIEDPPASPIDLTDQVEAALEKNSQ